MQAYLDNSATTQPTQGVIEAMERCMREGFYNPSSLYTPAMKSEQAMKECRERILRALGTSGQGSILFTSGGTESNNLAIIGAVGAMHGARHVMCSAVEHPSVKESFEALRARGHRVTFIPVDGAGQLDWAALEQAIKDDPPSLISCMQVNNETGAMLDVDRLHDTLARLAPECLIHVDGVQGFLRTPFDAKKVHLYTLSGHKLHGPKGIGALYVKRGVRLIPRQIGGGQEGGLRSGTENTPGIAGLNEAIAEMTALPERFERLREMKKYLVERVLEAVPEALLNGPAADEGAGHVINISFPGVRGEVMLHALEGKGVYVSTGSACSSKKRKLSPVLLEMGVSPDRAECALRFSLSPHTARQEIDYAAQALGEIYPALRRFQRR